ncbi:hypothetical protein [Paenibacillus oryzisoli]|uniref:Uncharacterized protein n=1 Tax=Paenibacillus oryzisoli TaxID=1850517 RepID=A0A198AKZ3_9BACL|nr:hypothetical protein [Paenibacillus oryzisoli]OAS21902.1 hypothetical protein A8708_07155 [Paenibacillus oryzisoli]
MNGWVKGLRALQARIAMQWGDVQRIARAVPPPEQLAAWLAAVQGPVAPDQLGVEPALQDALFVRNRFTILRLQRLL